MSAEDEGDPFLAYVFLCLCACLAVGLARDDDMVYTEADAFREAGADRKRMVKWESRKYKQVRDLLVHAPHCACCAILLARWLCMISWVCERAADMAGVLQVDR